MREFFKQYWPAILATVVLWTVIGVLLRADLAANDGHLIYTYDDAYIHLAMAKNLADYGIFGVTRYGFTSSASSMLWPLLLVAGELLFGAIEFIPLALNVIFATALVWTAHFVIRQYIERPAIVAVVLMGMLLAIPLPSLVLTGMEHTLQILMNFVVIFLATRILMKEPNASSRKFSSDDLLLLLASAVLVMVRYEGLFILDTICLLLVLRRRLGFAFLLGIVSLLPVIVFGSISLANGWYFLPNTLLLKSTTPDFSSLAGIVSYLKVIAHKVTPGKSVLALLIATITLFGTLLLRYRRRKTIWFPAGIMSVIFIALSGQHLLASAYDFRYGAYLIAIGVVTIGLLAKEYLESVDLRLPREKPIAYGLMLIVSLMLLPSLHRSYVWTNEITQASRNIYQQQYQMGEFVREFYNDQPVAVNDIGTISYFGGARTVDLMGLAHLGVAKLRRAKTLDAHSTYQLAQTEHVKIAIVYDSWFDWSGGLPREWTKVGEWKILNNVICGDDHVSIYAVDPVEKEKLVEHLQDFAHRLPKDVVQTGEYTTRLSER